jgi:hypothetical protein
MSYQYFAIYLGDQLKGALTSETIDGLEAIRTATGQDYRQTTISESKYLAIRNDFPKLSPQTERLMSH